MENSNKMDTSDGMEITNENETINKMEVSENTESYYKEEDYDWELDCPTDSEEALEIAMMYLDV